MSSLSDLTTAIKNKIIAEDPDIEGVSWFEERSPNSEGTTTPKIIIDVVKFRSSGYVSQRTLRWNFYYAVTGYLRQVKPDGVTMSEWTEEDRIAINDWAFKTLNRIYSLHDDKQAGTLNVTGFQQFDGEAECWVDLELVGQAVFKLAFIAIVNLNDTEEG